MIDRIPEIPGFWLIAGLALGTIVVELAIVLISWVRLARQRRAQKRAEGGDWQAVTALKLPSRLPEIVAALLPLAVAANSARLIQGCRNQLAALVNWADLTETTARLFSQALNGELNGIAMGLWAVPPTLLIGGVAVALAISARRRALGLKRAEALAARADNASSLLKFPGPKTGVLVAGIGAFQVLGLGPLARSGFAAIATTISHWAATTGLEWKEKGPIFNEGLVRASGLLDQGFLVARAGVVVAALVAVYLAWRFSPARARAGIPGAARPVHREGVFGPLVALGVIALSVAGYLAVHR